MDLALIEALARRAKQPAGTMDGWPALTNMAALALLPQGAGPQFSRDQQSQLDNLSSAGADIRAITDMRRAGFQGPSAPPPLPSAQPDPIADIPLSNRPSWSQRWRGMGADSLNRDPLGATRMTQPMIGGIPAAAPTVDADAQRAQALADLQRMQQAAPGIIEGLASNRAMAMQDIMGRLRNPGLTPDERQNLAFAGLNLNLDPSGRMEPNRGYPSQPSTRKYTDQRTADLAARDTAVKANAADRRDARKMRMGEGPAMYANRAMGMQQQAMNAFTGGGGAGGAAPAAAGDNPAAAGPAAPAQVPNFIDPIAGAMAGIPPELIAEKNNNTKYAATLALQQMQTQNALNDDMRRVIANTGGSPRDVVGVGRTPDQMAEWDSGQAQRFMGLNPEASRQQLEAQLVSQGLDPMAAGTQAFLMRNQYPHLFPAPTQLNPIASGLQAIGNQAMAAMPAVGPAAKDLRQTAIDWLSPIVRWGN